MSKTKIGGKKLIIQFGREETLFALWDKGPSFSHTFSLPTPEGAVEDGDILNADAIRDLLNTALGMAELNKVRNVVFALCTSQVISETISVPEMSKKKLDKLIHANVDMYFPVDMTDYRLVWQTIGSKTGSGGMKEQSVQLWAVPNVMLAPYYAIANECGLSVSAIDYCGNSIATAVGASFSEKKSKARPKLDLNAEISFSRKKKAAEEPVEEPIAASTTAVPMTDLHLTLDKDLIGITFVQNGLVVHQRFVRCGSNPAYQFDEVAMMVEYFRSLDLGRSSDFNAMVSGSLAEDSALVEELSFALDMPLPVFCGEFDTRWIVCAGAAQTALDFGNAELNNPVKNANPKANQLAQTAILTAGAAALAGVVALTFVARFSWNATIDSLESKRQTLAIQLQKVAGYADKYNEYSTLYDNYSNDWNTVFNNLRTYNDNLVRLLEELEDILPRKASVTAMTINADGLDVQFACDKKEDAAYLIMALRELQYADLTAISSLSGGGRGPANSYGNGEKAPTEGSDQLTIEQRDSLANAISADYSTYNVICALINNPESIQAMEQKFGAMPSTSITLPDDGDESTPIITMTCNTPDELESIYTNTLTSGESITLDMRKAAITALLDTNPFSSAAFINAMFEEDQDSFFLQDILEAYSKGSINYDTTENVQKALTTIIGFVTTDEEDVNEAEKLIDKDETLQKWYVHYLQEQINNRVGYDITPEEPVEYPIPSPVYLNMQAMIDDLVDNGQFDTDDSELNSALNGLLSEQTQSTVDSLVVPTPVPTPNPMQDTLITKYLTTDDSGVAEFNHQLDSYITTGDSGNVKVNDALNEHFSGTIAESTMKEIFGDYLQDGEMVNDVLNDAVDLYMDSGTGGNAIMDSLYSRTIDLIAKESWSTYDAVKARLDAYYDSYTSSGDQRFDTLLNRYNSSVKTTGSAHLDSLIEQYKVNENPPSHTPAAAVKENVVEGDCKTKHSYDLVIYCSECGEELDRKTVTGELGDHNYEGGICTICGEISLDWIVENYIKEGTTGTIYDPFLDAYIKTSTSGTPYDTEISERLNTTNYDNTTKEVVADYMEDGDIKNDALEAAIKLFMESGASKNATIDELLKRSFDLYARETWANKEALKKLLDRWDSTKKYSGDTRLDQLLARWNNTNKGSGSEYLDEMLLVFYASDPDSDKNLAQNAVNNAVNNSSGTGGSGTATDTRVSFTVSLGYNDELMRAELERKGLSDDNMLAKQEVNG